MGDFVGDFVAASPSPLSALLVGAGISSHSSFPMFIFRRKKGHSVVSIVIDSLASLAEIGTGEDLTIAVATSEVRNAFRFRDGVDMDPVGLENNIHTLSATPSSRPRRQRRLISS